MYLTLQVGDRLPTVALAQYLLTEYGELAVDGIFGPKTLQAVQSFQKARRLQAQGHIDRTTWRSLASKRPVLVVDVIDAADSIVLQEDRPYLDDGGSSVVLTDGMSRGTKDLIQWLLANYRRSSVGLLRFHGHGSPGAMSVAGGSQKALGSGIGPEHFRDANGREAYRALGGILTAYGSIELHGCRVAQGVRGRVLLTGMARACGVPVTAGLKRQRGGRKADRFEGPTVTYFPRALSLKAWARSVFNRSYA